MDVFRVGIGPDEEFNAECPKCGYLIN